jgi:hypothetical protein
MATLSTKVRNKLPKSDFGLPKERKYPMEDKSHAINAKARAKQQYNKGALPKGSLNRIDAKANKVLKSSKK